MKIHDVPGFRDYHQALRAALGEQRVRHCVFVTEYLASFAPALGVPLEQAVQAGMLHDLCRDLDDDALLRLAQDHGLAVNDTARVKPALLHGPLAALEARRRFDISPEAADAIYWHTTGRPDWAPLGLALYVADYAEPARRHPEARVARDLLRKEGFEEALLYVARCKRTRLETKPVVDPTSGAFFLWVEEAYG